MGLATGVKDLAPIIASMRWVILKQVEFPYFIIGDAPVTLQAPRDHPGWSGVGFLTPGADMAVPLDPQSVLTATHRTSPVGDFVMEVPERFGHHGRTSMVMPYNYRTYAASERWVYGRSQGDLEATRVFVDPERRGYAPIVQPIHGGPEEWERYKPAVRRQRR